MNLDTRHGGGGRVYACRLSGLCGRCRTAAAPRPLNVRKIRQNQDMPPGYKEKARDQIRYFLMEYKVSRLDPKFKLLVISFMALSLTVLTELSAATRLDRRMLSSLLQISSSLERTGKLDAAIQVLFPHRHDARILSRLADLYRKSSRDEEFFPLAEEMYAKEPENEILLKIYLQALGAVQLADSLQRVGLRFIAQSPQEERRYRVVAELFRRNGNPEQALELYLKGRKALEQPRTFRRELAEVLIDLGRFDQALDEMLSYLSSNPNELLLVQRQAYRILKQGEPESLLLIDRLENAVSSASSKPVRNALLRMTVDINLALGRHDRAFAGLVELLGALEAKQARAQLTSFIAKGLKLENYELVLLAYGLADSLELMDKGKILLEKADVQLKMGEVSGAEAELLELASSEKAKDLRAQAMRRLGEMYLTRINRPADALRWYRELEKIGKAAKINLLEVKLRIAESFIRLGQLHEARVLCDELLKADQQKPVDLARVLLVKADVDFYRGEPDSASRAYLTSARFLLGEPEANDAIERAYLIQNDKSPEARISSEVGRALHEAVCGNLQTAAEWFQETLQLVTDSDYKVQVYYQMGRMYETAGECPLALGVYEEIVQSFPEHHLAPMAELRMGLVLLDEIGDAEGARRHLERIVYDYPEGVVTPVARRLLRSLDKNAL